MSPTFSKRITNVCACFRVIRKRRGLSRFHPKAFGSQASVGPTGAAIASASQRNDWWIFPSFPFASQSVECAGPGGKTVGFQSHMLHHGHEKAAHRFVLIFIKSKMPGMPVAASRKDKGKILGRM
jgi:hypothetical protein